MSEYAHLDRREAFAEAFTSWLHYDYAASPDAATVALFENLAAE